MREEGEERRSIEIISLEMNALSEKGFVKGLTPLNTINEGNWVERRRSGHTHTIHHHRMARKDRGRGIRLYWIERRRVHPFSLVSA